MSNVDGYVNSGSVFNFFSGFLMVLGRDKRSKKRWVSGWWSFESMVVVCVVFLLNMVAYDDDLDHQQMFSSISN